MSVIVPFYNVEQYLAECLESLAAQTFADYEVLLVDDGSPDGSRAIAEEYAARDRRIRIVTRDNGGLGAARNTGIQRARGRYLTFVDSDDVLPPRALESLVGAAESTGSDIVVGAVRRFDSTRVWRPVWVDRVHDVDRRQIRVADFLPLLRNLYTWNKLYRHDFWKKQQLHFREGVAYEDQPIVTQLLARARSIDVITETVYEYRARDDRSSISQQTASLRDLRDRIAAWQVSRDVLLEEATPEIYHGWLGTLFDAHFHWYLTSAGTVDDTYWREIQQAVAELTADAPGEIWDATPPDKRVLLALTLQNRREDAQEFVRLESSKWEKWQAQSRADGILLHLPMLGDPALDEKLFLLRPEQLTVAHSVENFHWVDDEGTAAGTFEISGWAFIRKLDLSVHQSSISVVISNASSGEEHVFPSTGQPRLSFDAPVEDSWFDCGPGTFQATVPLGALMETSGPDVLWEVLLRVEAAGHSVTEPVTQLLRGGSAGVIPAATLADGSRLVARWRVHERLRFERLPLTLQVTETTLNGRRLSGRLAGPELPEVDRIILRGGSTKAVGRLQRQQDAARTFSVEVPRSEGLSAQEPADWTLEAETVDGTFLDPVLRERAVARQDNPGGALMLGRTRTGALAVTEYVVGALAEELELTEEGELVVRGTVLGPRVTAVSLATRHKKTRSQGAETSVLEGRFEARHRLEHEFYRFGVLPLPTGEHDVSLLIRTADGNLSEVPLKMSQRLSGELPVPIRTPRQEGRVVRGPGGGVRVSLVRPIGDARGRFRQHKLRAGTARHAELKHGVLMRSYFGEHATDNGVSVQKELQRRGSDLTVYWAVQDYSVPVPDGGVPVVINTREWYELLGSVKYYVDNMYQPEYHRKPDGQVIVQTFHGYPFKQMGHPHWENLQFSQARIRSYDERARDWDYLVSPARYATPLLRRDFAYDGEVLEIGYPRNDVLKSAAAEELRDVTRASLGIRDDQVAVLYAPTFRDYLARGDNQATMADFFDFAAATRALGEDVVILVRGHAFNARSRKRVGNLPGLVDVTDYPEVSDLYLAADAAVVDYSSLRFDFGVSGKPMVFHVPDLQRYKDTRGWLFDFEPTAPGPLVSTTDEVVEALRDLESLRVDYKTQYDDFETGFLDLEDGHAGERFVDAVFAPRGDA